MKLFRNAALLLPFGASTALHAQAQTPSNAYLIVLDRTGAPIYTAEALAAAQHWKGRARPDGRIELPNLAPGSKIAVVAQGFRSVVVLAESPAMQQHVVLLDVGGGSSVEVQPTNIDTIASAPVQLTPGSTQTSGPGNPQRVRISSGVIAGQRIKRVAPEYPAEARAQRVSGGVVMHVIIGKDGKVLEVTPISGPELLRKPYCDAVRQWEYRPYLLNGQPVEVETTVTINISIGS